WGPSASHSHRGPLPADLLMSYVECGPHKPKVFVLSQQPRPVRRIRPSPSDAGKDFPAGLRSTPFGRARAGEPVNRRIGALSTSPVLFLASCSCASTPHARKITLIVRFPLSGA